MTLDIFVTMAENYEPQVCCGSASSVDKVAAPPPSPTPLAPVDFLSFFLLFLVRIIPFQRPLKIKELLQKVTEAFGQQMDMFFTEKEVERPSKQPRRMDRLKDRWMDRWIDPCNDR